ncbi:MAG: biotin/lipoyl-binding protein [Acidobacteriota bacterium]
MKKFAIPFLAAISLTFAVAWTLGSRPVRRPTAPPLQPPIAAGDQSVAAVGLVEPESENVALSCAVPGLVTAVYVKAGDRVQASQPLFSVDDRDLQADLQVKRAALQAARARLARLQEQPRLEDIPPAEARVREAEAGLADAEVQKRLIESVTDRRAVREEDVQRRRLAYQAAHARLAEARSQLALLRAGAWAPDLAVAKAEVVQAENEVRLLETHIERLTARAPIGGLILQSKVRLGQYAACGSSDEPLMILGGGTHLHVRADVDENEAWRVRPDTRAVAYVRGDAAQKYSLDFVRFEPYVIPKKSLTGDTTERVDTRVLQIIYRVSDRTAPLYVGQQMDVYIETPVESSLFRHPAHPAPGGQP